MKKKFFKAVLFTVALATVSGTFVSCKDYDDDIKSLQEQVNQKALTADVTALQNEVSTAKASAQSALEAAKNALDAAQKAAAEGVAANEKEIASAKADIAALEKKVKDLEAAQAKLATLKEEIEAANEEQMEKFKAEFNTLKKSVEGMVGTMITDIELYYYAPQNTDRTDDAYEYNQALKFLVAAEKDNTFGPNDEVTFKKGNIVTYKDEVYVRVIPTNADLTTAKLSLVNTQGGNMDEFLTITPEPIEGLKNDGGTNSITNKEWTRAVSASGLWTLNVKLKDNYDSKAFKAAYLKLNDNGTTYSRIVYAVSVNNTEDATRNLVTKYALTITVDDATVVNGLATANTYVGGEPLNNIHNRANKANSDITKADAELVWTANPAVAAVRKAPGTINVANGDDRSANNVLRVEAGKPIEINIEKTATGNTDIKGFYVTLDELFAGKGTTSAATGDIEENSVSEINAWKSYEYDNLNTYIEGNKGAITVKNLKNVVKDVIGFRLYAVNLDGTLLDPDGAAFYVSIANPNSASTYSADATIAKYGADFVGYQAIDASSLQQGIIDAVNGGTATVTTGNNGANPAFGMVFVDKDKNPTTVKNKIKFVKMSIANAQAINFKDGESYTQDFDWSDAYNSTTLTATLTKVMPTVAPAGYSAKDKQIVNGVYTMYVNNAAESFLVAPAPETTGYMSLDNAFNGLTDTHYVFTFAESALNANPALGYTEDVEVTATAYQFSADAKLIDNTTQHATTVEYDYGQISSEKIFVGGAWVINPKYLVDVDSFNTVYACWHNAQSDYAWADKKDAAGPDVLVPAAGLTPAVMGYKATNSVIYGATAAKVNLITLAATNTYNNTLFGKTLAELISANYLKASATKLPKITSNVNGVEEYFSCGAVTSGTIALTPLKTNAGSNPTANVASTLTVTFEDLFGHEIVVKVPFTVIPQ